jgi:hypothetical protein
MEGGWNSKWNLLLLSENRSFQRYEEARFTQVTLCQNRQGGPDF